MSNIVIDIRDIYRTYFAKPYVVPKNNEWGSNIGEKYLVDVGNRNDETTDGVWLSSKYRGIDVMMPIVLVSGGKELHIPCATISCNRRNTIIRTAVAEREGTVKELFSAGDWVITIKGVLLGEDGRFPKEATERLIEISKNIEPLELWCGLTDMFMPGNNKVVVESLELPEIKGSSIRHRPFTMTLESDYVDTLIVDRS